MATGGYDRSVDSRVTCSICLEPYKGRQPKLLPCSHTFCLPCLTQIADKEKRRLIQASSEAETEITITCPTCRTPIPLPPAGVSGLNANIYVDDDSGAQSDPRPLLCDLCDEGQQAKLTCATCSTNFDTRCRRAHDRLCKSGQVSEFTLGYSQMAEVRVESGEEENEEDGATGSNTELQMMEALFKKMKEKEKKKREKQKTGSKQVLTTSASSPSGASLNVNTEQNANTENLASVVSQLMNKVTTLENQNALLFRDLTSLHDKHDREMTSLKAAGKKDRDAVASLQKEVGSLREKNAILCQDNQELGNDLTKLQKEVIKGLDDVKTLETDLANLQTTQSAVKAELTKYQSVTQAQLTTLQTTQSSMQAEWTAVKTDQGKLQTEQHRQKSDIATMKTGTDKLQKDLGKLESNFRGLRSKQDKLKSVLSKHVAFKAGREEWDNFTLNEEETVICDEVISSVGGGYDPTTGVFTVPVSGVYGFMFSSAPDSSPKPKSDDNDNSCAVDIMLDDEEIAYMEGVGEGSFTAHAFVYAVLGQKVFVRSNGQHTFDGSCSTFSGVLIQPDL